MIIFLKNVLELFGIIYLRFRMIPRVWCVWLLIANAACLLFITHLEAQVVLAVTGVAVVVQTFVYQKFGFIRILGTAHVLWIPMFAWMATRIDTILLEPELANWLVILFLTNLVSAIIDTIDAVRFLRGERSPFYHWVIPQSTQI